MLKISKGKSPLRNIMLSAKAPPSTAIKARALITAGKPKNAPTAASNLTSPPPIALRAYSTKDTARATPSPWKPVTGGQAERGSQHHRLLRAP